MKKSCILAQTYHCIYNMKKSYLPLVFFLGLLFVQCTGRPGTRENVTAETASVKEEMQQEDNYSVIPVPSVSADKILETIVGEYKGKVVFVDFWATWCMPCLKAMQSMKAIKPQMKEQGVVSVYISNASSPKEKWANMLPNIGGLHYYLEEDQWRVIVDQYNIAGIPTYMIFDKAGAKTYESAGYPGNETILEELGKVW